MKRQKIVEPNQKPKKKAKVVADDANSKQSKVVIKDVHSVEEGKNMFQWIIDGISVDSFMK